VAFRLRKDKGKEKVLPERAGGWYADPYGQAARRWFDVARGWTDRVEGAGQRPDKTGPPGVDEAAASSDGAAATSDGPSDDVDANGKPAPLSRAVDSRMSGRA